MYFSHSFSAFLFSLIVCLIISECYADVNANPNASQNISKLVVDAGSGRNIPNTLFGVFYEEINHAGAGGLWAELVNNRGFEGGVAANLPPIYPWKIVGENQSSITVSTDLSSCFERNKIALRMDILCQGISCPRGGVGISNPGYWGMNVEQGKDYKVVFYVRALAPIDLKVSFVGTNDGVNLGSKIIKVDGPNVTKWSRMERIIKATGHGFRSDLFKMVADLKPKFLRFPGGCYVEGDFIKNAFRWKDSVGPWEERSGHLDDIWHYWSDDGLGYFEGLQLAEDLGALPIWVFNNGFSHHDEVSTDAIQPFVDEALDGIEFARGPATSRWGSLRASMGHPEPFNLKFVAIGNEDCDIYDYHIYTNSNDMFSKYTKFDKSPRSGPKAFVSEYAVWKEDARVGSLYAAVAEAAFLIGIERNSDVVSMVSYAPLLLNTNDRGWIPDAIVFDSYQSYGTPSYWVQRLFIESSGATLLNSTLQTSSPAIVASTIKYKNSQDGKNYLRVKVVNFGKDIENLGISINGLNANVLRPFASSMVVLTSSNIMDENSFSEPMKIVPRRAVFGIASKDMNVKLSPYSVTSLDLLF
ncbi:hypothetical protein TSUD_104440 [Trifolium subterraneum]|uniref:non-reducing end alpha-L-arabinofuranosidase n=1 Tax=Trifolium subterraneum TaxID=3900 RepID=A0A2Z6MTU5_TRISU|nr:hypothetical protein TSUD_104440 [Trifolium subterraneum]